MVMLLKVLRHELLFYAGMLQGVAEKDSMDKVRGLLDWRIPFSSTCRPACKKCCLVADVTCYRERPPHKAVIKGCQCLPVHNTPPFTNRKVSTTVCQHQFNEPPAAVSCVQVCEVLSGNLLPALAQHYSSLGMANMVWDVLAHMPFPYRGEVSEPSTASYERPAWVLVGVVVICHNCSADADFLPCLPQLHACSSRC